MSRKPSMRVLASAVCVLAAALVPAAAETIDSTYTSLAAKNCRKVVNLKIEDTEYAVSRTCAGPAGYKVYIAEEDLRETLSIGKSLKQASAEPAAQEHYGAFNGYEDVVEWRSLKGGGVKGSAPFAAIVGWYFADNENL